MQLYYSPLACSMGIHLLLEEIGQPYETRLLPLKDGAQHEAAFTAVNPKSKVPTLVRDDGSVITEYGAIATWLARKNPEKDLLPDDMETEVRVREALDFCVGNIHKEGYTRVFRPEKIAPAGSDMDAVKARGREIVEKGYSIMEQSLDASGRLLDYEFSIADSALFYVEYWSTVANVPLPPKCRKHLDRMLARPATQAMLKAEDLL